jgi:MFS family permease
MDMTFQPADNLRSRTFIGLLIAQFLAAFNDQAIHASAMFFAINTKTMSEAEAISLMPILFYAPWALFCTLAGYFADHYSKRTSLVLWKFVEVGITLLALAGFWIGRAGQPTLGAGLVLSTVFLMGMHSAFFVPAKYGAMPEILTPRRLSRGNGVLESLSFLAVILGTVAGGVLSTLFRSQEFLIGIILTTLAVVGALASLLIRRIPVANPSRPFPTWIYQPLVHSIRQLLTSRPLVFAVIGIAFFTFLVAFMRATVYMHGQSQAPRWSEAQTSYIVGMVALGIGLGSPLVGFLSGGKVEVGLVPIGALGMVLATSVAALALDRIPLLVVCVVFTGFFTGFYLVPLFSLLQHRAAKTSKGDAVATSNFINITGAIAASLVLWATNAVAVRTGFVPPMPSKGTEFHGELDSEPQLEAGHVVRVEVGGKVFEANEKKRPYTILQPEQNLKPGDQVVVRRYGLANVTYVVVQRAGNDPQPPYDMRHLPALLFLGAGGMTLFTLLLLWRQLPDLFLRTRLWMRGLFLYRLEIAGMLRLPANGPAILATDAADAERCSRVLCATDRVTRFLLPDGSDVEALVQRGKEVLAAGGVVGLSVDRLPAEGEELLLGKLEAGSMVPILPVHYAQEERPGKRPRVYVIAGKLLPPNSSIEAIRGELQLLHGDLRQRLTGGEALEKEEEH